MSAKDTAREMLHNINEIDEETLRLAARSAYDQNPDLMTPQELLLFVLFGYTEEPPENNSLPNEPVETDAICDIEEPI